jgi:AcrR family transcriptional regulator
MTVPARNSEQTVKIVQAAAQLFARQGYHGTSTKEIARIAGVSENTVFRHFAHKEDIFWTALRSHLEVLRLRRDLMEGIAGGADPEVIVPQILAQLVDTTMLKPDLLRLIAVAHIEFQWKAAAVCNEYLSPIFSAINGYLAANIEIGKMRNLDAGMVTAALATTVIVLPEFSRLIHNWAAPYSDNRGAVRAYTKFWLEVLAPGSTAEVV